MTKSLPTFPAASESNGPELLELPGGARVLSAELQVGVGRVVAAAVRVQCHFSDLTDKLVQQVAANFDIPQPQEGVLTASKYTDLVRFNIRGGVAPAITEV